MTHLTSLEIDAIAGKLAGIVDDARAREHLATCARCRDDLAVAETAMSEFSREVLPRMLPRLIRPAPWWKRWLPAIAVPVLAAAVVALWLGRKSPDAPDVQIKGDITFEVFAKRGDNVIQLRDGTKLRAGDAIRFIAGAQSARYLLIGSVDGSGAPTLYYPYGGPRSRAIGKAAAELPGSIVLDAAPGPERVFAVFSAEPIEGDAMTRALAALGARGADAIRTTTTLDVAGATAEATVVFEKETP